ncbi:MAG: hypothetical protein GY910_08690 [bacterium]|nr:hypothetical protein [bacterium]
MITVALSATIDASHERVWRALVDPTERLLWDERILGEITLSRGGQKADGFARLRRKTPENNLHKRGPGRKDPSPAPLRTTRWRFQLGGTPLVMQEEVRSALRHGRLDCRILIGSMRFDQTFTLHPEDDETGPRTRLGMKVVAGNSIAVIGEVVGRLEVQKIVIEHVDTTLRQIQKFCASEA